MDNNNEMVFILGQFFLVDLLKYSVIFFKMRDREMGYSRCSVKEIQFVQVTDQSFSACICRNHFKSDSD